MFREPTSTQYDLTFSIAGFPVRVHPLFWLIALLFGSSSGDLVFLVIWVVVVFISILIHELGHAFAMRAFGQGARIVLYGAGGLAIPERARWGVGYANVTPSRAQKIFISFAGPLAGFILAGLVIGSIISLGGIVNFRFLLGFIPFPVTSIPNPHPIVMDFIRALLSVNIFWGLVNLVPVFPLDGGQIAREVATGVDPINGLRVSLWISVVAAVAAGIVGFFQFGSIFMALLFGYLAYQSYQMVQGSSLRFR